MRINRAVPLAIIVLVLTLALPGLISLYRGRYMQTKPGTQPTLPVPEATSFLWTTIGQWILVVLVLAVIIFGFWQLIKLFRKHELADKFLNEGTEEEEDDLHLGRVFVRRLSAIFAFVSFGLCLLCAGIYHYALQGMEDQVEFSPLLALLRLIGWPWVPLLMVGFILLCRSFTRPGRSKRQKIKLGQWFSWTVFTVVLVVWSVFELTAVFQLR